MEQALERGLPLRIDTIANRVEFDRILPYLDVLARATPEDKYAFVVGLKERYYKILKYIKININYKEAILLLSQVMEQMTFQL